MNGAPRLIVEFPLEGAPIIRPPIALYEGEATRLADWMNRPEYEEILTAIQRLIQRYADREEA